MRQLQDDIVERRRQSRMEQEPFIEEDEGLSDWSKFDESRKKCQISHPGHKPNSPNWTSSPLKKAIIVHSFFSTATLI